MKFFGKTALGTFTIENSCSLEELKSNEDGNMPDEALIPMDWVLNDFPCVRVNNNDARRLKNGLDIPLEGLSPGLVQYTMKAAVLLRSERF